MCESRVGASTRAATGGVLDAVLTGIERAGNAAPLPALGFAYGMGAGAVRTLTDAIGHVAAAISGLGALPVLLLVITGFIAFFSFTDMATALAAVLADAFDGPPIAAAGYVVIFVPTVVAFDLLISGAVANGAIFAPVFIPLFMPLGGDPDLVLAACRVGDSPANVITPLDVHPGVRIGFAQNYAKDAGIGAVVALTPPCTVVLTAIWTLFLVLWNNFGAPLGPA